MATIVYPYVQYSGIWTMQQVNAAVAAGTWPTQPFASLYSWGFNNQGQLGLNNSSYVVAYSSPKQIGSLATWLKVAAGSYVGTAIKTDDTLWTWGFNYYGQLGVGDTDGRSSPVQIGSLRTWDKIASGSWGSAAIKKDGTLWTWGQGGAYGALGLGNTTNYSSPKQVGALSTWAYIDTKAYNVAAIKTDGTLWVWGANDRYQLATGDQVNRSSPVQVGALTTWARVSFGVGHCFAIKTDGTLWGWGFNHVGQLGLGNTTYYYSSPAQIGALTNWARIVGTQEGGVAVKTDGTMWAWGANGNGQLGLGNTTGYSSPKQIGALTTWSSITGWQSYASAVKTDGTLWAWGRNNYGQLGLGDTTQRSSPVQVGSSTKWYAVAGGQSQTIAVLSA